MNDLIDNELINNNLNELENHIFNNFDNISPINIKNYKKNIKIKKNEYNYTHSPIIKYKYIEFKNEINKL